VARLSPAQIGRLWIQQGGRKDKVAEAVAVAMCESVGGDTKAKSSVGARGLWQFMPETLPSDKCAYDPVCSTREAVKLSNRGDDFSAWDCHPDSISRSGYSTGDETYEQYQKKFVDLKLPIGPDVPFPGPDIHLGGPAGNAHEIGKDLLGVENPLDTLKAVGAFFQVLGELTLTQEGWLRTGKMVGGSILVFWGLRILVRESTGSDPVKTVKKGAEFAATAVVAKKLPV
jgi:hypothetical protein